MGLEFKTKNINLLDDLEAELSKKLNIKITFDDNKKDNDNEKEDKKDKEN